MAAMEGIEKEPDIIKPVRQSGPSPNDDRIIHKLPTELWLAVLDYFEDTTQRTNVNDLARFSLCCHYFYQVGTQVLYRSLVFELLKTKPTKNLGLIDLVDRNRDLGAAVRSLKIIFKELYRIESGDYLRGNEELDRLMLALPYMSGLQYLECVSLPWLENYYPTIFMHPTISHLNVFQCNLPTSASLLEAVLTMVAQAPGGDVMSHHFVRMAAIAGRNLVELTTDSALLLRVLVQIKTAPALERVHLRHFRRGGEDIVMNFLEPCVKLRYLHLECYDLPLPEFPATVTPDLNTYIGTTQHALEFVPGRPVEHVKVFSVDRLQDRYDLVVVPRLLRTVARSTVPLLSLDFALTTPTSEQCTLIQELFPSLRRLLIQYMPVNFETTREYIRNDLTACLPNTLRLLGFVPYDSFELAPWGEQWDRDPVRHISQYHPLLTSITLTRKRTWIYQNEERDWAFERVGGGWDFLTFVAPEEKTVEAEEIVDSPEGSPSHSRTGSRLALHSDIASPDPSRSQTMPAKSKSKFKAFARAITRKLTS